jgi:hypothetical protein
VLAPPFPLVPLLGARPEVLSAMNRIFVSTVSRWVESQVSSRGRGPARTGAVTFIQRLSREVVHDAGRHRRSGITAMTRPGHRRCRMRVIAVIQHPAVASRIVEHLARRGPPLARGPP